MKADKSWGIEYFHRMLKIECLPKGEGSHSNGAHYTERLRNLPKIRQQFNCCLNFKFRALSSGVIFKGSSHPPSRGRITKKETQSRCAEVKPRRGEGSPNSLLWVLGWACWKPRDTVTKIWNWARGEIWSGPQGLTLLCCFCRGDRRGVLQGCCRKKRWF